MKLNHAMCDEMFKRFPLNVKRQIINIEMRLRAAKEKHSNWPKNVIEGAAIVGEESGELLRAALQYKYEKGPYYQMHDEAIDTAAMGLRFLIETGPLPEHRYDEE